jgi:HlyD family secretion protein
MRASSKRTLIASTLAVLLVVALLPLLAPQPVLVDLHRVTRGPMQVSVSEEGKTRLKDIFTVSAPISGRLQRVELDSGDPVEAGKTVLTSIEAPQPRFYDLREATEKQARVASAEAQRDLAAADIARAKAELAFAEADLTRNLELAGKGASTARERELAEMDVRTKRAALVVAQNNLAAKTAEVEVAKAEVLAPGRQPSGPMLAVNGRDIGAAGLPPPLVSPAGPPASQVLAPVSGVLLRKIVESETSVGVGDPLFDLGDPTKLEVVVEMLSEDAVKVHPGATALLSAWGSGVDLHGTVRRVEPYGFTKISALGIEEQRVNVVIDFVDPAPAWERLGHGYRIDVSIVVWRAEDVLKLPLGALFRRHNRWAVYTVDSARLVRSQEVEIGHTNNLEAEVIAGLIEMSEVILHPSDHIADGARVEPRDSTDQRVMRGK